MQEKGTEPPEHLSADKISVSPGESSLGYNQSNLGSVPLALPRQPPQVCQVLRLGLGEPNGLKTVQATFLSMCCVIQRQGAVLAHSRDGPHAPGVGCGGDKTRNCFLIH